MQRQGKTATQESGSNVGRQATQGRRSMDSRDTSVIGRKQMERIKGLQAQEILEDEEIGRTGAILLRADQGHYSLRQSDPSPFC